jgi:hypothetical protein
MNSFNNKIDEWGDNWCDIYSNCEQQHCLVSVV